MMQDEKAEKKKNKFLKILRYSGLSLLSLFVSLLIFTAVVIIFFQDKIIDAAVNEINKKLNTKVEVEKIDLRILSSFPYASIDFHNVIVHGSGKAKESNTLLQAKKINLFFNIIDIFYGNYDFHRIQLNNGSINIQVFPDGTHNYDILLEDSLAQEGSATFELREVIARNMHIAYNNAPAKQRIELTASKLSASGKFSEQNYTLKGEAELLVHQICFQEDTYLKEQSMSFKLSMNVVDNEEFIFNKADLSWLGQSFSIAGSLKWSDSELFMNTDITGGNINLDKIKDYLPEQIASYLKEYSIKGLAKIKASIMGSVHKSSMPQITAEFSIQDGTFTHKETKTKLRDVQLSGSFTNGKMCSELSSVFELSRFSAKFDKGSILASFHVENLINPQIKLLAELESEVGELLRFFPMDTIEDISGHCIMHIDFQTRLRNKKSFSSRDFIESKTSGNAEITLPSMKLKQDKRKYHDIKANLEFSNNDVIIKQLNGKVDDSDFQLKGIFKNVLSFIFLENQNLYVEAEFESDNINMNELLSSSEAGSDYNLDLPDNIFFDLKTQINSLEFRKFTAKKISGRVEISNKNLHLKQLKMQAMGGDISLNGTLQTRDNEMLINCKANLAKVNIQQVFIQLEEFGQNSITSKNIKGLLSCDIDFAAVMNKQLEIDDKSVTVKTKILLEKGELIEYKPLEGLSKFIDAEDLKHIRFENLTNEIEIRNRIIYFPNMDINNNVMNLSLSGKHTFDNEIDYHLTILRSEIPSVKEKLRRKAEQARKENEEFGVEIDDGLGRTKYYIHIYGTVDDPKYAYDRRGLQSKIKEDIKKERENLKDILREEFPIFFKKDTVSREIRDSIRRENKKDKRKEEEGKFVIEF